MLIKILRLRKLLKFFLLTDSHIFPTILFLFTQTAITISGRFSCEIKISMITLVL